MVKARNRSRSDSSDPAPARFAAALPGRLVLASILLLVGAGLRLPFLDADPPADRLTESGAFATDEGNWSFVSKEWAGGLDPIGRLGFLPGCQALVYASAQYVAFKTLGVNLTTARLSTALLGSIAPALIFLWGRRFLGTWPAFVAGLLVASSYWLAMYQRTAMSDGFMVSWAALAFVAWESALASGSRRAGIGAGLFTGLAIWSKISALPLIGAIVLAGFFLWLTSSNRARIQRVVVGFGVGFLAIVLVAAIVYLRWPEIAAAALETYQRVPIDTPHSIRELLGNLYEATFRNPAFTFYPIPTLLAYLTAAAAGLALLRRRKAPVSVCALIWIPLVYLMLAVKDYEPNRYYLQTVPPVTILAIQGWSWFWSRSRQPMSARRLMTILTTILLSFEIGLSLARTLDWIGDREYTQRDIGLAIANQVGEDEREVVVSGSWSHNLALSGGFRSAGAVVRHPRFLKRIAESGSTHYVSAGPVSSEDLTALSDLGFSLEELGSYSYLRNYFEPYQDLVLYRLVAD